MDANKNKSKLKEGEKHSKTTNDCEPSTSRTKTTRDLLRAFSMKESNKKKENKKQNKNTEKDKEHNKPKSGENTCKSEEKDGKVSLKAENDSTRGSKKIKNEEKQQIESPKSSLTSRK